MSSNEIFLQVQQASRDLLAIDDNKIKAILNDLADLAVNNSSFLLNENQNDLDRMDPADPKFDRLKLTKERINSIAHDIKNVAVLPSPLGLSLMQKKLENGLYIEKISVPLGVIGIIYEARPNVTFDVFSLCLKSGNACILKGGRDAEFSNRAISGLITRVLEKYNINKNIMHLLDPSREATEELLNAVGFVDIIIPRGSQQLINHVRQNAKVPVIETGAGIVHTYFDQDGDKEKGKAIIDNAKTRRVSVCNALDCLVIHKDRLDDLPELVKKLEESSVEVFADEPSYQVLSGKYSSTLLKKADTDHFGTEFLDYKMSVKTVNNLDEALSHIAKYSSKHSEAIISENPDVIDKFLKLVDAAAVYANTSTAFTDGAQFGLGAEIGISTQKLHARGPMGLQELTSYKWIIKSKGTIRIP